MCIHNQTGVLFTAHVYTQGKPPFQLLSSFDCEAMGDCSSCGTGVDTAIVAPRLLTRTPVCMSVCMYKKGWGKIIQALVS